MKMAKVARFVAGWMVITAMMLWAVTFSMRYTNEVGAELLKQGVKDHTIWDHRKEPSPVYPYIQRHSA